MSMSITYFRRMMWQDTDNQFAAHEANVGGRKERCARSWIAQRGVEGRCVVQIGGAGKPGIYTNNYLRPTCKQT